MSSPAVTVIDVSKQFGSNFAAKNINLQIESGEFFSFLGPSGCGKTTLLRMIAGFETPTSGQILITGIDMVKVPPHKRPVNMVFQNYALFPHLTVAENIAFGLKSTKKFSNAEIGERVKQALDLVRLASLSDRTPAQLSGGQQQRIALARAAVNSPAVLLLDEPLSALDPQIREEMQVELASLQQRLNMTFIMVTHDQDEALALSDRIAVFCQGNLEQVGSPEEIYESPKTRFVAEFIGRTNLLNGVVKDRDSSSASVLIGEKMILTVPNATRFEPGESVVIWTKPHSVQVFEGNEQNTDPENVFDALVVNRSYQGTTTEYVMRIEGGVELKASCLNEAFHTSRFEAGKSVKVRIPAASLSVLSDQDKSAVLQNA